MKNYIFSIKQISISIIVILFFACEKQVIESVDSGEQTDNDLYFVSISEAKAIASQVLFENTTKSGQNKGNMSEKSNKKIKKSKSFPDKSGKAAGHIINFEEGGWIIVSADKRTEALLAFSNEDRFELNVNDLPPGPKGWVKMVSEGISYIRSNRIDTKAADYQGSWEISEIENALSDNKSYLFSKSIETYSTECYYPGYPPGCTSICQDTYFTKGPLLNTQWGQDVGYNNLLPIKSCYTTSNGRAPAGCSAVAMAQVMKYHGEPSQTYNFSAMPNSTGSSETSKLTRDIGATVNMKYWCAGSWLYPWVMDGAFGYYSYGGAIYEKYDPGDQNIVKSELNKNQPVILEGKDTPLVSFQSDQFWHIWVCDGYRTRYDCQNGIGYLYFHMNWGWNGNHNGWYGFQNWNVDGENLEYRQHMVYNIKP